VFSGERFVFALGGGAFHGARTGLASVAAVAVVAATLLFLTPLLYHLPQATLAAVIMMAVVSLVNFEALWHA